MEVVLSPTTAGQSAQCNARSAADDGNGPVQAADWLPGEQRRTGASVAQSVKRPPSTQETQVRSLERGYYPQWNMNDIPMGQREEP